MHVFGIGTDIVPVDRFIKLAARDEEIMLGRLFTLPEQHDLQRYGRRRRFQAYAASFAVKESVYKALGTGLIAGMSWKDIEVREIFGTCQLTIHGQTLDKVQAEGIASWQVSCSVASNMAIALTVLLRAFPERGQTRSGEVESQVNRLASKGSDPFRSL